MGPVMALLSSFDEARLERLLLARPDLLMCTTLNALAQAAGQHGSVQSAAADLPMPARQVAEAMILLGGRSTLQGICDLDPEADPELVAQAMEELQTRLLATGDNVLSLVQGLTYSLPTPLGLGRPVVQAHSETAYYDLVETLALYEEPRPRSGDAARAALAQVLSYTQAMSESFEDMRADLMDLLRDADRNGPVLRVKGLDPRANDWPDVPGLRQACAIGLLAVPGPGRLELPREVGLALRWPRVACFELTSPDVAVLTVAEAEVAAACGAAVQVLLDGVHRVMALVQERPLALLGSGGIGVKELRALAGNGLDAPAVALVLNLLEQLGLITSTRKDLRVTKAWDVWAAQPEDQRWLALVLAWLDSRYVPATSPATDRRLKPALSWDYDPRCNRYRSELIRLLAAHRGRAYSDSDWLLLWRHRWPEQRLTFHASRGHVLDRELRNDILYEAQLLGLLASGAGTPLAAALHDMTDVAPVLAGLSDQGEQTVRAQADMTLICTGRPSPAMRRDLDRIAHVEQSNAATVWRISEGSLARAYTEGDEPAEVLRVLEQYAGTIPQAMTYLVSDARRRFGRVQVGSATSYVVVDNDDQLQDALARRGTAAKAAKAIGLVRIAPGVAVSKGSKAATVAALKELGLHATVAGQSTARTTKSTSVPAPVDGLPVFDLSGIAKGAARRLIR